jgi:molecular chaperone DnaJ
MNLYDVLGVKPTAGPADIRRAYRRLARRYHPDINPGDGDARARFDQIARAFETLSDPDRRHAYDAGRAAAPPPGAAYGFEGFDFSVDVSARQEGSTFGELFADVLTRAPGARGGPAGEPGADIHADLAVSFTEAMSGADRAVSVTRQVPCRTCGGRGAVRVDPAACPACQGRGQVRAARGYMVFTRPCEACGGTGTLSEASCRTCRGLGLESRAEGVRVHVPAGVAGGTELRVPGLGHTGSRGGRAGDLVLTLSVGSHPLFAREGDDLHLVVPVAVHEAALGAKIEIPTLDGPVRLRVPPGTQSGQRLRLRERGAPSMRGGVRGDLIVEVRVVLPPLLDERSKELLREFGRINGGNVRQGWG